MSDQVRIHPCRPTISEVKEQQLKCATPRQSVLFFRLIHGISRLYGNLNVRQHEDYWEFVLITVRCKIRAFSQYSLPPASLASTEYSFHVIIS